VLWDFNGTLVDDSWLFVEILNSFLKKNNKKLISVADYCDTFFFPIESFYKTLGLYKNKTFFNSLNMEFINQYKQRMFEPLLHSFVLPFLKNVPSNISHFLLSAQQQKILDSLVLFYSLDSCFEKVVGVDNDFAQGKEESALLLKKALCQSYDRVVVVGDTMLDYRVSRLIGASCVLVSWGHYSIDRFSGVDCFVCDNPFMINAIFKQIISTG